ncbi:L-2-hydroxyglutarate oxidase [Arthrobacter sunyaminii]|uniref:L-2-hydroxyglutarate oxidase n=1 Tax=Arthrobacter sunyaminii TaxID=2816859 RepID=A0A975PG79_9MICC|nr:L-2-hydroxyglutarate oxidase [Arthrobacter sunyaminii]MBO0909604.1 L-2-hydroxyglutarate oxidase [Arthrobacter sunyaminii]QWQ36092.1 L-2-hydroxyglutarate oxidase [Arthrobacter sunyaminii]
MAQGPNHAVIAGAGIVGLATALELARRGNRVTVLDKESSVAAHQTGNNSGVIHSGLYYTPGSLKAALGAAGASSMRGFAETHGVDVRITGKLVVATRESQLPALKELLRRGMENGVPCRLIGPEEARGYEPNVQSLAALRVESTGIVDYRGVCAALVRLIREAGGEIHLNAEVSAVHSDACGVTVETDAGTFRGHQFVNCAGLHSDRVARLAGIRPDVRIIPFRGEYFELTPQAQHLVNGLIYPVPDPAFPFLGVHLTKMTTGSVHAGPNAVFALAREGYTWLTVNPRDVLDSAAWPGLWKLGAKFWRVGLSETTRSLSRKRFLAGLRELVPALPDDCLVPAHAGVRAQAMRRDGTLVDDFLYERAPRQIHVLNAPSPAATAALEIGRLIANELTGIQ